jgi:uncharacterized alpha/beta hydrolase family protein
MKMHKLNMNHVFLGIIILLIALVGIQFIHSKEEVQKETGTKRISIEQDDSAPLTLPLPEKEKKLQKKKITVPLPSLKLRN